MTRQSLTRNSRGFTIIETLFVLAIAGIIMLIVFQAIPALVRNSRNNERKQDVAAVLSAVSSYQLRNSGNFCDGNQSATACNSTTLFQHTKLSFYEQSAITALPQTAATATDVSSIADHDTVQVYNYHRCITDSSGETVATNSGAGYLDIAAVFYIQGSQDQYNFQCQQL